MNPKSTATPRLLPWLASCLVAIGSLLAPAPAHAQPSPNAPDRLTYQGFLVDANGAALAANAPRNYDIVFRIYNDANGGTLLWSEQQTVTVDRGNFSVMLGEGVAVTGQPRPALSSLFKGVDASERYIGLLVNGIGSGNTAIEINPRLRLLTSPYAFLAQQANKLVNADGSDLLSANNNALMLDGTVSVRTNGFLELGGGLAKEANSGRLGYGLLTPGALDIFGGGTTAANRQIKIWAEGGTTFTGPVTATLFNGSGAGLTGVVKTSADGHISVGDNTVAGTAGYGKALILTGAPGGENSDPLWLARFNAAPNASELRVNIGDDPGSEGLSRQNDKLVIGTTTGNGGNFTQTGSWSPLFGFTAGGNLGVGTDSPVDRLDVRGGITMSQGNFKMDNTFTLAARNSAGTYETFLWPRWSDNIMYLNYGSGGFHIRNNNSGTAMFMRPDGRVGIGLTDPLTPLHINSADPRARMTQAGTSGFMEVGRAGAWNNGFAFVGLNNHRVSASFHFASYDGDSNWDFTSDRNLKKDIVDAEPMLERALKIQVRRFRWKESEGDSKHMLGVIAQEVQLLFPDMVGEQENPQSHEKHLTVGYGDFGVIAIKAIQELKASHDEEVRQLRSELAELKSQLKDVLAAAKQLQGAGDKGKQAAAVGR